MLSLLKGVIAALQFDNNPKQQELVATESEIVE